MQPFLPLHSYSNCCKFLYVIFVHTNPFFTTFNHHNIKYHQPCYFSTLNALKGLSCETPPTDTSLSPLTPPTSSFVYRVCVHMCSVNFTLLKLPPPTHCIHTMHVGVRVYSICMTLYMCVHVHKIIILTCIVDITHVYN